MAIIDVKLAFYNVTHAAMPSALDQDGPWEYIQLISQLPDRALNMSLLQIVTRLFIGTPAPQGGVFSPTLFNIAAIGLADELPCTIKESLYADGVSILASGRTRVQLRARPLNATLIYIKRYIQVSNGKSFIVVFTRQRTVNYSALFLIIASPSNQSTRSWAL